MTLTLKELEDMNTPCKIYMTVLTFLITQSKMSIDKNNGTSNIYALNNKESDKSEYIREQAEECDGKWIILRYSSDDGTIKLVMTNKQVNIEIGERLKDVTQKQITRYPFKEETKFRTGAELAEHIKELLNHEWNYSSLI